MTTDDQIVDLNVEPPPPSIEILQQRTDLRRRITECRACALWDRAKSPVPFSGPTPAPLTILGQGPGSVETSEGRPFVGPAGSLLRRLLRKNGFPERRIFFTNATQCWPPVSQKKGGGDREPTQAECMTCSGLKIDTIALARSPVLLIVGKVALRSLRPDLADLLGHMRQRPMYWMQHSLMNDRPVWWSEVMAASIYHPAAALRNPSYETMINEDLAWLRRSIDEGFKFVTTCVVCREPGDHFDVNGIAWCHEHSAPLRQTTLW